MPARRLNDVTVVVVAAVLVVVLGALSALVAPAASTLDARSSTFNPGPGGTKAAYVTLRELGYRAERSVEPLTALHSPPAETVLIVSGDEPASEQDRRAVQQFLQAGGTLLAIGANGARFFGFSVRSGTARPDPFAETFDTPAALTPTTLTNGAPRITMIGGGPDPQLPSSYLPIYGTPSGTVVAATARIGEGRAIWWAAATPLTNAHVTDESNLQLVLNVAGAPGARAVLFDEHYHGHRRSLASYTVGTPLPWIALQLGLVAAAVVLTYSRRSGPVRARLVEARTSPLEFVDMLGALYQRGTARAASVQTALARLRRTIAAACGVPANGTAEALAQAAASKLGTDAAAMADLLAQSDAAVRDADLSAERALGLTRRLQELAAALQAVRGRWT